METEGGPARWLEQPGDMSACSNCSPSIDTLLWLSKHWYADPAPAPTAPGHTLVLTRRHVDTWADLTPEEKSSLLEAVEVVKALLDKEHAPTDYSIEFVRSAAAGMHVHAAVLPLYCSPPQAPPIGVHAVTALVDAPPEPHLVQVKALEALRETREAGNRAGLVVMATGLGKTWLAAFDSNRAEVRRILFVAHREEILNQAMATFRRLRPSARLGHFTGEQKDHGAQILFASVQTLARSKHLTNFGRHQFNYIVIDEFHHASAATYRKVIDWFQPDFLLGLTATPERTDGGDLLALCQENLVYRCDMFEGIRLGLLSTFKYFGVPDEFVDYQQIPWRNSKFDTESLSEAVETKGRAQNALDQLRLRGGERTMAFCVSVRHAEFMAQFFTNSGLRAAAVHSGPTSSPRASSLQRLESGDLDVVCTVDMFNEGLDMPSIDTVLMLRPTESRILWLQQFGRGLRVKEDGRPLTVIDYIGNHHSFLRKPEALFGLGYKDLRVRADLDRVLTERIPDLPEGCEVTYDLVTVDILRNLLREPARVASEADAFKAYYDYVKETLGDRPTAVEAFHDGYDPSSRAVAARYGSWLDFVARMGDLSERQVTTMKACHDLLAFIQTCRFDNPLELVLLESLVMAETFPAAIPVQALLATAEDIISRSGRLQRTVSRQLGSRGLRAAMEEDAIRTLSARGDLKGQHIFEMHEQGFGVASSVPVSDGGALLELVREILDWRMAEFLAHGDDGAGSDIEDATTLMFGAKRKGSTPFLERVVGRGAAAPDEVVRVRIGNEVYLTQVVDGALMSLWRAEDRRNSLPGLLRTWFGGDVGDPRATHRVAMRQIEGAWQLAPVGGEELQLRLWQRYSREQIPGLFGLKFSQALWNTGFVRMGEHVFLLVTLQKGDLHESFQYQDRFVSPSSFQWQSQNKTRQLDGDGLAIRDHVSRGLQVHLFVRLTKKTAKGVAVPFVYCGDVSFERWQGEQPITVWWSLAEPVPERMYATLRYSEEGQ